MNAFQKTAITTLVAILLLIGVGSLVRVSGAGLGVQTGPGAGAAGFRPRVLTTSTGPISQNAG